MTDATFAIAAALVFLGSVLSIVTHRLGYRNGYEAGKRDAQTIATKRALFLTRSRWN